MSTTAAFGDVTVDRDAHIAIVTLRRPPENYFDAPLIADLADAYEHIDSDGDTRAIVLTSEGRHFCAGAALTRRDAPTHPRSLYEEATRLFACELPVVAAVNGAAIGGGLGVAMSADFRVGTPDTRVAANFARLGFHHGFALTVTLPAAIGQQRALEVLYSGERFDGEAAHRLGILDRVVPADDLMSAALELAGRIAASAPLAVRSIRATMRADIAARAAAAMAHEEAEQGRLRTTADFAEGVRATAERRAPTFRGE
jgi:2-(1,2-epoxy-1,2-dihydrophenyl)acetyl-CoA isomerase